MNAFLNASRSRRAGASVGRMRTRASVAALAAVALSLTTATPPVAAQPYTEYIVPNPGLPGTSNGTVMWGDYNWDERMDILAAGTHQNGSNFTQIFRGFAGGTFTQQNFGFAQLGEAISGATWCDYDNDNDLDVLVAGSVTSGTGGYTRLYRNQNNTFTQVSVFPSDFIGLRLSSVSWGDYDNDGDQDFCISGCISTTSMAGITRIYRNDGAVTNGWKFTDIQASIAGVILGASAWGDYDRDGDLDLAVTGSSSTGPSTRIYRNEGGVFVESGITNLYGVIHSSIAWGDYNNDNYVDLALVGTEPTTQGKWLKIYRNNAGASFSQIYNGTGVSQGSVAWGDYDNDGNLDVLIAGAGLNNVSTLRVHVGPAFGLLTPSGLTAGMIWGSCAWGDWNKDGKLDILAAGTNGVTRVTKIFNNTSASLPNQPPTAPASVTISGITAKSATINWTPSTDDAPQSLTYNLYIVEWSLSTIRFHTQAQANTSTGFRYLYKMGNVGHATSWTVTGLTPGKTYYACVQAIDGGFVGSAFTCSGLYACTTKTASAGPDVFIRDCASDVGAEPSTTCSSNLWSSPDIWVRNNNDNGTAHQEPIPGRTNYVYVRMKNRGGMAMASGRLSVFWSKASTGQSWQKNWVYYKPNSATTPLGDIVGTKAITNLGVNATTIAVIPWNVASLSGYGGTHPKTFCLLARFHSYSDPMTTPEGPDTWVNVKQNNNIAWRNTSVTSTMAGVTSAVDITNYREVATPLKLEFNIPPTETADPFRAHGNVFVDLGPTLFQRWQDGGFSGSGVAVHDTTDSIHKWIQVTSDNAYIRGFTLDPDEIIEIGMKFELDPNLPAPVVPAYGYDVVQFADGETDPMGGESYEIWTVERTENPGDTISGDEIEPADSTDILEPENPEDPEGMGKPAGDRDGTAGFQLSAYPNPTGSTATIDYTLPVETAVTIAIYDAAGQLVRRLISDGPGRIGMHSIEWDGMNGNGAPVGSGTYFYRLETSRGTIERQIKIIR